jgi:hypothetical protein
MSLNKYIKQYPKQTAFVATDAYLFQRGGNYYYIEQSDLFADLANYIPLAGSSLITGDLKYTKGSAANFGTADNFGLNIITNNATVIAISSAGVANFKNDLTFTKGSAVNFGTTDAFALNIQQAGNTYLSFANGGNITISSGLTLIGTATYTNTGITKKLSLGGETGTVRGDFDNTKLKILDTGTAANIGIGIFSDGTNSGLELYLKSTYEDYGIYQNEKEVWRLLSENANGVYGTRLTRYANTVGFGVVSYLSLMNASSVQADYAAINAEIITNTAGSHSGYLGLYSSNVGALVLGAKVLPSGNFEGQKAFEAIGTGGASYYGIVAQSSNPSAPSATGLRVFSNSSGYLAWAVKNGSDTYVRNLIGVLGADRSYTLSDSDQTLASQTGIYFGRYSSYYYEIPKGATDNLAGAGWVADRIWATPFPLGNMNTISELRVEITTAVAASTVEIGVYADDGTGYPGTLLGRGSVDSSGTGFKTVTGLGLTNLLQYKQVWLAMKASSNSIGIRYTAVSLPLIPRTTGTDSGGAYYYAGAAGNLPTPFAAGATLHKSTAGVHLIGVKM